MRNEGRVRNVARLRAGSFRGTQAKGPSNRRQLVATFRHWSMDQGRRRHAALLAQSDESNPACPVR